MHYDIFKPGPYLHRLSVRMAYFFFSHVPLRSIPESCSLPQQQILGKLNGQVEESISGLNMVKAFGREKEMIRQFEESNDQLCQVATKAQIWSGFLMPLTNVINNLNFVIVAVISGILAAAGRINVGLISSFLLYSRQFSRPFVDIANIYNNFQTAVAGAERIF